MPHSTPPPRPFTPPNHPPLRVMNDSPIPDESMSPPPAYGISDYMHTRNISGSSTNGGPPLGDRKEREITPSRISDERMKQSPAAITVQRLPPRSDSLHRTRARENSPAHTPPPSLPQALNTSPTGRLPDASYSSSPSNAFTPSKSNTPSSSNQTTPSSRHLDTTVDDSRSSPTPNISISIPRNNRPPRLSLHQDDQDDDLTSWSAALLSAVSSSEFDTSVIQDTKVTAAAIPNTTSTSTPKPTIPETPLTANSLMPESAEGAYHSGIPSWGPSTPLFEEVLGLMRETTLKDSSQEANTCSRTSNDVLASQSRGSAIYMPSMNTAAGDRDSQLTVSPPVLSTSARLSGGSVNSSGSRFSGESVLSGDSHSWTKATIVRAASILIAKPAVANMIPTPRKAGANTLSPLDAAIEARGALHSEENMGKNLEDNDTELDVNKAVLPREPFELTSALSERSTSLQDAHSRRSSSSDSSSAVLPYSLESTSTDSLMRGQRMTNPSAGLVPTVRIRTSPTESDFHLESIRTSKPSSICLSPIDNACDHITSQVIAQDIDSSIPGETVNKVEVNIIGTSEVQKDQEGSGHMHSNSTSIRRPQITVNGMQLDASNPPSGLSPSPMTGTPATPSPRYQGWVTEVVAPLEEFIDDLYDPRELFGNLIEIAEGESGSVYAARVLLHQPKARMKRKSKKSQRHIYDELPIGSMVAIKNIPISPTGSPKLQELFRELKIMSNVRHKNILSMDGLYVDFVEDALWIQMELMERSLADILALADEGLIMQETIIARFSSDVSQVSDICHDFSSSIVHFMLASPRFGTSGNIRNSSPRCSFGQYTYQQCRRPEAR